MRYRDTPSEAVRYLDVLDEVGRVTREIVIAGQMTIGRRSADFTSEIEIPAECRSASRQHAKVEVRGEQVILTDTSRFGTMVNGNLIEQGSVELHHGDMIIFGLPADGWRVKLRVASGPDKVTLQLDPLESLTVRETPRQVLIGRHAVEEHLGDRAFRLLKFLADNKGKWYPVVGLAELLWPDPDQAPFQADQALSRFKKAVNDLLRLHLKGQDAIESWPHRGYRMKPRLRDI